MVNVEDNCSLCLQKDHEEMTRTRNDNELSTSHPLTKAVLSWAVLHTLRPDLSQRHERQGETVLERGHNKDKEMQCWKEDTIKTRRDSAGKRIQ